jgi:hypothetical protein
MPGPEPATRRRRPAPTYPQVRVRLSGGEGDPHILIGKVAVALRRQVGDQAADAFNAAAQQCAASYDEVLHLVRATVRVR